MSSNARRALLLGSVVLVSLAAKPKGDPVAVATQPKTTAATPALAPQDYQKEVASIVADMLDKYHYLKHPIDDEISRRWLDSYVDSLDGGRTIFLQSDIDEFHKAATQLDDDVKARPPRLDLAFKIYARYSDRVAERYSYALGLLDAPLDLANAEKYTPDRRDAQLPWPATTAAANELWRQRTEDEVIADIVSDDHHEDEPTIRARLHKRYERALKAMGDTESTDVLEVWLGALATSYDPHSVWFKPATNDDFNIDITNSVEGIGAQLQLNDDYTTVTEIIAGGPAYKDERLKKEDRILMVGQEGEEPVDVVGMRLDKVVKLIRGPKGTVVTLHLQHKDGGREVVDLVREQVVLEESAAEGTVEHVEGHTLGVVHLPSFYVDPTGRKGGRGASEDVKRALVDLEAQGVEGVVLDLRGNGGGSLTEAIEVAGLFLPGGPVVQVRSRDGRIEAMHDSDPAVAWDGPLEVLTDATSASASEIVAGALQDYGRALIVGDKSTHGKGSVQQIAQLTAMLRGHPTDDIGGALKLTVQKFYRVSGGSTQNKGVEADVVLPSYWDGLEVHESDQDYAMPWDQIPPAPHVTTGDFRPMIAELQKRSNARRTANAKYDQLSRSLELRQADKADHEVSLVLTDRQADYAARKAKIGAPDEEEPTGETPEQRKARRRAEDFGLDEGLAVMADVLAIE